MPFLQNPLRNVLRFFSLTTHEKSSRDLRNTDDGADLQGGKRCAENAFGESIESDAEGKRKRQKVNHGQALDSSAQTVGTVAEASRITEQLPTCGDQALMPPPSMTRPVHRRTPSARKTPRLSLDHAESASQATRSTRVAKSEHLDEYDMEEARRKAAATQLPPDSGIWEAGERELFFHLSYRGFEPLLPKNWMIDFPTLPLAVFAHQDTDEPLIECHRSTEFRAIRALRELIDTGTTIRDRTVSNHDLRTEPILERAITKYTAWALKDLGYPDKPSRSTIPVHTIATIQPGQSTQDVIRKLASEMHILAAKHREAINVSTDHQHRSHAQTPPRSESNSDQVESDADSRDRSLPVIYGIMIASSILAIFTLNSQTPFPPFFVRALLRSQKTDLTPERAAAMSPYLPKQLEALSSKSKPDEGSSGDEDSGIRYIASFDFSNSSADVWNALVVAILAMQIRKQMGEVYNTWQRIKDQQGHTSPASNQVNDDGDIVANRYMMSGALTDPPADIEDSWISNVDEVTGGIQQACSSPASGRFEDILPSPMKRIKEEQATSSNGRSKSRSKARRKTRSVAEEESDVDL